MAKEKFKGILPKPLTTPEERALHADAGYFARKAVKDGAIKRLPCEVCGAEKVEMHHENYHKPLDVVFLCRPHHSLVTHGYFFLVPRSI